MKRSNKVIRFRVMVSLLLFCMMTALAGLSFLNISLDNNLTVIGEEQVALGASMRPDQTFFPEVLFAMILMLVMFLVYFYWRECNKQITRIRNLNDQISTGSTDFDHMSIKESMNLFYLKNLAEGNMPSGRKSTIKNMIAE
ncbi:MAG: hypothetical protein PHT89_05690 [Lachnospiraceae bacterium]|nr:hypothetical protein [Lachnospiraceae bacterium]